MNRAIAEKVSQRILPMVHPGATVAVLGLAYKPFSHVTEESQGVYIAQHLSKNGMRVVAYDPMSNEMALNDVRRNIVVLDSLKECLSQATAVLITTPDPVFKALSADDFRNEWSEVTVFDFWRLLRSKLDGQPHIKYIAIGASTDDLTNTARLKRLWWGDMDEASRTASE